MGSTGENSKKMSDLQQLIDMGSSGNFAKDLEGKVSEVQTWIKEQPGFKTRSDEGHVKYLLTCAQADVTRAENIAEEEALFRATNTGYFFSSSSQVDRAVLERLLSDQVVLPLHAPEGNITVWSVGKWKPSNLTIRQFIQYAIMVMELDATGKELSSSEGHLIFDFKGCGLSHLSSLTPNMARDLARILNAWPNNIVFLHVINAPTVLNAFFALLKASLPAKLRASVYTYHSDLKQFNSIFSPKQLPSTLGGKIESKKLASDVHADVGNKLDSLDLWESLEYNTAMTPTSPNSADNNRLASSVYRSIF